MAPAIAWPETAVDVRGIRFRSTALVAAAMTIALLVGGVIVTTVLRDRLTENLDATLRAAATDRAGLIAEGVNPDVLTTSQLREAFIWIGTADGTTLASGGQITPTEPFIELSLDDLGTTSTQSLSYIEDDDDHDDGDDDDVGRDRFRLAVAGASDRELGDVFVVVASELEAIDDPVADVASLLLFGAPVLILLVAALTWITADRALRPVETIRMSAENVRNHHDGYGIDVPSTGDEIQRLGNTINEMVGRLAQADQRQRQFVGDASHELKSPLANLRIDIETAQARDDRRELHLRQIDRLTAIVDDLLVLARHDEDRPLALTDVDLDDIVFDVLAAVAPGHGLSVEFDAVSPARIVGDPSQLSRLVRNIVDNATRHAHEQVTITLNSTEKSATLHVDDDGPGVANSARDTIFERFGRSDEARARNDGGTGLGLAIAKRIAERHRGSIAAHDSPLGGARFTVTLPTSQ